MIPTSMQRDLAQAVINNLEHQESWTRVHKHEDPTAPRILVCGLPPRRLYIHPDEQVEIIKAERALAEAQAGADAEGEGGQQPPRIPQPPEHEWILPLHLNEKLSVSQFSAIFDSIGPLPPGAVADQADEDRSGKDGSNGNAEWRKWRGPKRLKRIVLAIVQDDSTVVYYIMHDGIVKPRQN